MPRNPETGRPERLSQPKVGRSDRARAKRGLPPKPRFNPQRVNQVNFPPSHDPYGLDQPTPATPTEEGP